MRILSRAFALLAASGVTATSQVAAPRGLRPLETVRVQESDTLFLARPALVVLGPRGHVYLMELREARILEIGPSGNIGRVFGRKGRGPGEFESPTTMTASGDSLLAVYDHAIRRVTYIDLRRWTLLLVSPLLAKSPPVIRFADGDLMVTVWDFEAKTSIARAAEGTGALEERQGVIPSLGAQTELLISGAFWNSTFAPVGDEIFAMYEVSNSLFVWKRGAREAREIALPVVRRRGVRPGYFESLLRDPAGATPAMLYDRSAPVALGPVSGDVVAVVTMDVSVEGDMWSGTHHVTLYDRRRNRVCADLEVPATRLKVAFGKDPLPSVAIRGDTIALLEPAESPAGDPVHLLRRYRIEPSQCDWRAIDR